MPTNNSQLLFSNKTSVVPSIKNKFILTELNAANKKSDLFTLNLNEIVDVNCANNDEDLLFARFIIVRLKKFKAIDRQIVCLIKKKKKIIIFRFTLKSMN